LLNERGPPPRTLAVEAEEKKRQKGSLSNSMLVDCQEKTRAPKARTLRARTSHPSGSSATIKVRRRPCAKLTSSELILWQPFESPEESYITSRLISERRSRPTRRHGRHGKTLRRSRAMSGSAGPSPSRKMRQGSSMSKGCARSLKKGCGGRAAGPAVRIDKHPAV
jgi:hypothetical protein